MKKRKRIFICMVAFLLLAFALVACDKNGKTTAPSPEDPGIFMFGLIGKGDEYCVAGVTDESATEIVIPAQYNGLPVTKISDKAFEDNKSLIKVTIPESVKTIGMRAFSGCTSLAEINIPESVLTIGEFAFNQCESLVEIIIPDSVVELGYYAFNECTSLERVRLSDNIKHIYTRTFYNCRKIREINLPKNLETVGEDAFYCCSSMMMDELPSTLTKIGDNAFSCCYSFISLTFPESLEEIGRYAFASCKSLVEIINHSNLEIVVGSEDNGQIAKYTKQVINDKSESHLKVIDDFIFYDDGVDIPLLVKYLGDAEEIVLPAYETGVKYNVASHVIPAACKATSLVLTEHINEVLFRAFEHCENLVSVTFSCPNAKINWDAFDNSYNGNMEKIKTVYINTDSVRMTSLSSYEVGDYSYSMFNGLETVVYGEGVKVISENAFYQEANLKTIILSSSIEEIGKRAFYGCKNATFVIPEDIKITEIKDETFYECSFTNFVVPENVTYIGEKAFAEGAIESITFNENITEIGKSAFSRCRKLNTVDIPDSVEVIGESAFSNCKVLSEVNISENSSLHTIKRGAFDGCGGLVKIILPKTLTTLETRVFSGCTKIRTFEVHPDNPAYTVYQNNLYNKDLTVFVCQAPGRANATVIPASVKKIEAEAFYNYKGEKIIFAEGSVLEEIGYRAFYYSHLKSISFPSSLITIGEEALANCQSLESIDFGENSSVVTIGDYAFSSCYGIDSITIPTSVQTIGKYAFVWKIIDAVYYNDTGERWRTIAAGSGWDYEVSYVVHATYFYCTDETIRIQN